MPPRRLNSFPVSEMRRLLCALGYRYYTKSAQKMRQTKKHGKQKKGRDRKNWEFEGENKL
ncbi:hypothetical protein B484DRAFT_454537, partial [Ochromonadaceae sp. CCMP2298]